MKRLYREHANDIHEFFQHKENSELFQVFNQLAKDLRLQYLCLTENNKRQEIINWLQSYIHMSLNRILRVDTAKYEYIIYHLLNRYFKQRKWLK